MATPGPASTTARALAREQLTATILRTARDQLGSVGPAQLSVRAVAREVGMVSSAVYRYFPSRDELLTELLVVCFDEVGAAVETAEAEVEPADHLGRWLAVAHAFRAWAVDHPYDFALLYGSPVPGYAAPERTIGPAGRVPRVIVAVAADQFRKGSVRDPHPTDPPGLHAALAGIRSWAEVDLPDESVLLALRAWGGLIGALTLELFGHLANALDDQENYFDAAARRIAPLL